ncbi:MAG: Unknown protein [uncultured Sulfurovum sp.]|uniref:Uncharacterized protein n=1 Tax=uncultured Sulfurovum sp. TaxID=269237 RepID=A0A6S6T6Q9_9BACT|nr:MAG: Unknown protein [uncultured Sulfurovum sp.]
MSWFSDKNRKIYPTKMFVNYLPEDESTQNIEEPISKSIGGAILMGKGFAIDMLLNAAPKFINQGMELMNNTLNTLANDQTFPSNIRRNFDIIDSTKLSLPNKITLVRGNFANNLNNGKKGIIFGDGIKKNRNQALLLGNKELHIEIDVIQSKDKSAIYFQTNSYFYAGRSPEGDKIDEIVLAFAFLPAGQSSINSKNDFKNFLHFTALTPNQQYNFKSQSGYDTSFQSAWMTAPFDDVVPYTMLIQIQEIREGNFFAKLMQTLYVGNESNIKSQLNTQVSNLKEDLNK